MPPLVLDVRLDGFESPIGKLSRKSTGAISFSYTRDYLLNPEAAILSLALPPTDEPYDDISARAFFDNLLQERDQALAFVMNREGIPRDDVAGLLFHMGKDCAGALSVLPEGASPVKVPGDYNTDYAIVSPDRMEEIVDSLHRRRRLPNDYEDPSPLAGMQSKIALTVLPDGSFAEPNRGSGAPTTHILKVPDSDHPSDAINECEAMKLSRKLGFQTAEASVVPFAGVDALLVTRYDRARDARDRVVRIHQEDFAQALGLPPSLKYERNGVPGRRFDVEGIARILLATADPVGERVNFLRATIFDLLIGNTDGHAKNFAIIHERGGSSRISPRYDLLPTRLDPNLTDALAYKIGNAETLDEIGIEQFDDFLSQLGVGTAAARHRLRTGHTEDIAKRLARHLHDLDRQGLKNLADLIASNIRILLGALDRDVPLPARNRDAFVVRGGGWLLS